MKPIVTLAEATLANGSQLALQEHDGRRYLVSNQEQIAGPGTRVSERELARIACAPFRPARQPKVWITGLALGETLEGLVESLNQKRATFYVGEASDELVAWHREFFAEGAFTTDPRVERINGHDAAALNSVEPQLHAILIHADTAPLLPSGRGSHEDRRWLSVAFDSLQSGGLIAVASSRKIPKMERNF
ncbi:MAG: hypothetical protein AAGB14_08310 [Verrucomicrobiota bacterium]